MSEIRDIETKIDKIKCILNQLYNQLYLGYCSFVLTNQIQRALVDGRIIHLQELLKTTYFACGNSAILIPRTLVEEGKRKENINLHYLFREWEWAVNTLNKMIRKRNPDEVSIGTLWQNQKTYLSVLHRRNDILESISKHRQQLFSLKPTLAVLEEKRSYYIAHISKQLLKADGVEQPVYTYDLNKIFQALFDIIKIYYEYLNEQLEISDLEELRQIVENDFSLLIKSSSSD